ncbi:winged helix-turn-helix transcriptional regulator [Candidatus Bipolaricaulota bacterium]|nr:winged helix-turn-helix transcriptional regulator [Candidatus Bipolaricaulota bacterium]
MNKKIQNYKFFNPTKALREYLLLEAMSGTNNPSQRELSRAAGISPSVTNKYLGEFEEDGLLQKESLNKRDYKYQLTKKGEKVKRELMVKYIRETFQMFSEGKQELADKLQSYQKEKGFKKIIFYSAGEVTELLIHSLNGSALTLQAIVDDDEGKQGKELFGYPVISRDRIPEFDPDAVIVTTFQYRQDIIDKLEAMNGTGFKIIGF